MGLFVAEAMRGKLPTGLFLTGGETVTAVLEAIGARGIRLRGEIFQGMPEGTLMGGPMEGLAVVTKAGAFGTKGALVVLHEYWSKRGKEKLA